MSGGDHPISVDQCSSAKEMRTGFRVCDVVRGLHKPKQSCIDKNANYCCTNRHWSFSMLNSNQTNSQDVALFYLPRPTILNRYSSASNASKRRSLQSIEQTFPAQKGYSGVLFKTLVMQLVTLKKYRTPGLM